MSAVDTLRDALFGNPPSPTMEPSREGTLAAFTELHNQAVIAMAAAAAGLVTVSDTSERDAFYADEANQGKLVYVNNNNGEPDDPDNGVYEYVAGAPRIAEGFYQGVAAVVQPLVDAAEGYADAASASALDAAASSSDLRYNLSTVQLIGPDTVDAGSTSATQGTFTFARALANSGKGFRITYSGKGTGTAYFQLSTRVSNTITIDAEYSFPVTAGINVVEFPNVEFTAGQLTGFRALSGLIGVTSGSGAGFGGYYAASTQVSEGDSYDDSAASNADFKFKVEALSQPITGDGYEALQSHVGEDDPEAHRIGLPDGVAPVTGSAVGAQCYVFNNPIPFDGILSSLDGFSLTPGDYLLYRYNLISGTMTAIEDSAVTVTVADTGAFASSNVPYFEMNAGEYMGVASLGGKFSLTAADGHPTAFWAGPADGSSFSAGAATSTLTFNFAASFVPKSLSTRLSMVEAKLGAVVEYPYQTNALWLIWGLGESHMAGRSPVFASAIPIGRGYQFRRSSGDLAHLEDPTGNYGETTGSWGPAIGQTLLDLTDGTVGAVFVNSGHGGDTIDKWASGGTSWATAVSDLAAAKTAITDSKVPISGAAIMIAIGTNDMYAETAVATFKAGMIDLFTRARAEMGAGDDVPIILTQVPPYVDSSYDDAVLEYQQAIAELCRDEANVFMGSSATKFATEKGWFNPDHIHLNDAGNQAVGSGVAPVALAHGAGFYPEGLE